MSVFGEIWIHIWINFPPECNLQTKERISMNPDPVLLLFSAGVWRHGFYWVLSYSVISHYVLIFPVIYFVLFVWGWKLNYENIENSASVAIIRSKHCPTLLLINVLHQEASCFSNCFVKHVRSNESFLVSFVLSLYKNMLSARWCRST